MRRIYLAILLTCTMLTVASAQDRTVQNRPYTDLRKFHFGLHVGTHLQDIEFVNVGPITLSNEDGTTYQSLVTLDQDRWDPGFNVGVLGEFRLSENFQLRIAPAMYFGTRHITFHNYNISDVEKTPIKETQGLKTAYITSAFDIIFAGPRFNNRRPYIMAGVNPMINLSNKDNDFLKLKRYDMFLEIGIGCDFYLPFFKARPELKFMYGLTNSLDTDHAKHVRDKTMLQYTNAVSKARSKMITFTLYFE
ncbi:MAG: PorT family protein [Prevotella sp.]|nr:PorT family protein [Prevotella sp.]